MRIKKEVKEQIKTFYEKHRDLINVCAAIAGTSAGIILVKMFYKWFVFSGLNGKCQLAIVADRKNKTVEVQKIGKDIFGKERVIDYVVMNDISSQTDATLILLHYLRDIGIEVSVF